VEGSSQSYSQVGKKFGSAGGDGNNLNGNKQIIQNGGGMSKGGGKWPHTPLTLPYRCDILFSGGNNMLYMSWKGWLRFFAIVAVCTTIGWFSRDAYINTGEYHRVVSEDVVVRLYYYGGPASDDHIIKKIVFITQEGHVIQVTDGWVSKVVGIIDQVQKNNLMPTGCKGMSCLMPLSRDYIHLSYVADVEYDQFGNVKKVTYKDMSWRPLAPSETYNWW
jgi:hypothetical protein